METRRKDGPPEADRTDPNTVVTALRTGEAAPQAEPAGRIPLESGLSHFEQSLAERASVYRTLAR